MTCAHQRAARGLLLAAALLVPACGSPHGSAGGPGPALPGVPAAFGILWGNGQAVLFWNPVPGADRYSVYRATAFLGPYALQGQPSTPGFINPGLTNGLTYYYFLRAANGSGEGPPTTELWGVPNPMPAAPAGLTAVAGTRSVDLSWSPVAGATGYQIQRTTVSGGPYSRKQTSGPASTTFSSTGLPAGTTQFFIVRALSGSVVGPASPEAAATPTAPPPAAPAPAFNQARGIGGVVRALAAVPGGSGDVYVGGDFSSFGGTAVRNLFRLKSDGTIQSSFAPTGVDPVLSLAPATDASGDLYVGTGAGVLRLNSDGTLDGGFVSPVQGSVQAIATAADGSGDVLVGGAFQLPDLRLARLNGNGTRDASFAEPTGIADAAFPALALAPDGSGDIYVGGASGTVLRLNPDGSLDGSFTPPPSLPSSVAALGIAGDGSDDLYIAGQGLLRVNRNGDLDAGFAAQGVFTQVAAVAPAADGTGDVYVGGTVSGAGSSQLLRLRPDGTVNTDFLASFDAPVAAIAVVPDASGDVYAGGEFRSGNGTGIGGLARVNADGTLDPALPQGSGFSAKVVAIAPATDGSGDVYVGGDLLHYDGAATGPLARLNANGTLDPAFADAATIVHALVPVPGPSGDLYVGGAGIRRLNSDGSTDPSFATAGPFDDVVLALAIAPDASGDLYAGGRFTSLNGSPAGRIVRLLPGGAVEPAFATGTGFDGEVTRILAATDGSGDIFVCGEFANYNGSAANRLVRLNADGSVDTGFAVGAGFNAAARSLSIAADGSGDLYVGGAFTTYQGGAANRIVRLNADGTVDAGFAAGAGFSSTVNAVAAALDGSGDVYVGGDFAQYQGAPARNLVRLNADGSVDAAFAVGAGCNDQVRAIVPLADGRVLAGGRFTACRSTTVDFLARLRADGTVE